MKYTHIHGCDFVLPYWTLNLYLSMFNVEPVIFSSLTPLPTSNYTVVLEMIMRSVSDNTCLSSRLRGPIL